MEKVRALFPEDRIAHMQAVARVPFPAIARKAPALEPDLIAAVKHNVRLLAEEGSPLGGGGERAECRQGKLPCAACL